MHRYLKTSELLVSNCWRKFKDIGLDSKAGSAIYLLVWNDESFSFKIGSTSRLIQQRRKEYIDNIKMLATFETLAPKELEFLCHHILKEHNLHIGKNQNHEYFLIPYHGFIQDLIDLFNNANDESDIELGLIELLE